MSEAAIIALSEFAIKFGLDAAIAHARTHVARHPLGVSESSPT